jgi:uncharacterized membrane protein
MGKIFLILGILGVLLGGAVAIVSLILPQLTRNVSYEEATIGLIAGAVIFILSFVPVIIGVILMILKKKNQTNG